MNSTQTGACRCGATVERDVAVGRFADFANGLPFVCPDCMAAAEQLEQAHQQAHDREQTDRRIHRLVEASGLPEGLRGFPLDHPDALAWTNGQRRGLLLTGPVGVGKTTAAAAAAERVLRSGRTLRWMSAPLLFARLGSGLGSTQRDEALNALTGRHALVLDDIDKARPTEYAAEHIFLAVDTRVTERAPLLCTSNLGLGELAARWPDPYGEAVASRLAGYCSIVRMAGPDRRMAAV